MAIHQRYMDVLVRDGVVEDDDLLFEEVVDDVTGELIRVRLSGHVTSFAGARIRVLKWMDARPGKRGATEVLTVFYQYQAWLPAEGSRPERALVRYDQAHGGQPHRHQFDASGTQIAVEILTFDSMPRLDAVIREVVALVYGPAIDGD